MQTSRRDQALQVLLQVRTREIAREAASLRTANASLRLPDAFVLAMGEMLDAAMVLSGDPTRARM
jgi:hypothetical protein